jgi:hypothetical protein
MPSAKAMLLWPLAVFRVWRGNAQEIHGCDDAQWGVPSVVRRAQMLGRFLAFLLAASRAWRAR